MADYDSDRGGRSSGGGSAVLTVVASLLLIPGILLAVVFFFLSVLDNNHLAALRSEMQTGQSRVTREQENALKKINDKQDQLRRDQASINKKMSKPNADLKALDKQSQDINQKLRDLDEERSDLQNSESSIERRKKWEEEKTALEAKMDDSEAASRKRRSWYLLGMMVGFVITTVGSVCFLLSSANRIAAAILIYAVLSAVYSFSLIILGAGARAAPF